MMRSVAGISGLMSCVCDWSPLLRVVCGFLRLALAGCRNGFAGRMFRCGLLVRSDGFSRMLLVLSVPRRRCFRRVGIGSTALQLGLKRFRRLLFCRAATLLFMQLMGQ